ncbi:MAG: DDE-type integrase/transposase/recombinase, partial [Candidatus Thiodiazotropha taylori]|nr:DDE-type integrase/transposase/recombinase [Candidatus Thiodiazotropha taylori]
MTIKDAYPLPRIDESLDQLAGSKWFSCLDLSAGYWQVEVEPDDKQKTAFVTRQGLFEFNVMPMGLCNAPATFERLMETVLSGLHWQICLIYLDDIIIIGKTFDHMIRNLDLVLDRFSKAGLKLKPKKCQIFRKEVEFLGHIVDEHGVSTDPGKIQCIKNWPEPSNLKEVRSFLGLCSYYRRFIADYSTIAKPLTRLTEKNKRFDWTTQCTEAFERLKNLLITAPVLAHPDFSKPFIIDTDASDEAIGAVLSQKIGSTEEVVAYANRTLTKSERKYCVTRKELLALVYFVKYFRHYLYGRKFTARTDHGSLKWIMNFKNPEGQVARWLEVLSSFSMTVEHRPGRLHGNADSLSRKPCNEKKTSEVKVGVLNSNAQEDTCLQITSPTSKDVDDRSLKILQKEDNELSIVRNWVADGEKPNWKDISSGSYILKSLWNQFTRLELQDELLVRRWDDFDTGEVIYQALVPRNTRRLVLNHCHDIKTAGHLGMNKTVSKVRQKFYWPGLQSDVRSYIAGCEACVKRKEPIPTKRAPMQIVRSGYPMERIALDILGELPLTSNGNKYIVVVADYFTKWTEALPMPNMEACTVAKLLVEEILCRFGLPQTIHSDQGRQFESHLFQEMCKLLGIEKTRTTPYHPQSDGMVERFNRTLATMLSAYVSKNQKDWDEHLPYVMMAYRSSTHETTGMSPNILMFGREVSTPLDLMFEMPPSIKPIPNNQWVWELREKIETAHEIVRQNTRQSMCRQKRIHDTRTSYEKFEIGDQVY